ncbi:Cytochrome c oxidase subunit 6B-like protein new16 [Fusarium oxysporum f. sp. albedinis]|nr:Cytochrome c oxidase subunit 6B-like protein new16 [Fusarium oxysporum f. sp. albedinis]
MFWTMLHLLDFEFPRMIFRQSNYVFRTHELTEKPRSAGQQKQNLHNPGLESSWDVIVKEIDKSCASRFQQFRPGAIPSMGLVFSYCTIHAHKHLRSFTASVAGNKLLTLDNAV